MVWAQAWLWILGAFALTVGWGGGMAKSWPCVTHISGPWEITYRKRWVVGCQWCWTSCWEQVGGSGTENNCMPAASYRIQHSWLQSHGNHMHSPHPLNVLSVLKLTLFNFIKLLYTININTTKKVITMILVKLVYFPSYRILKVCVPSQKNKWLRLFIVHKMSAPKKCLLICLDI